MAELINLKAADRYLAECDRHLNAFLKLWDSDLAGPVSEDKQLEMLNAVYTALTQLKGTVMEVMHNNRDGRGTPPSRPKINSMMDRAR